MTDPRILILGAGPAGAATAIGLRRLGYAVSLVSEWRRFAAVEGLSQRSLEGLRHLGLQQALISLAEPSQRWVHWNGLESRQNIEYLLDRPRFDAGLREDLVLAGVKLLEGQVLNVQPQGRGWQLTLADGRQLDGDFLVEARGRQAPLHQQGLKPWRGPETLSLLSRWQGLPQAPSSAVESVEDGWVWMARLADGRCYWQLTLDANHSHLPAREALLEYCRARRAASALAREFFAQAPESALELHARSSTSVMSRQLCGDNWIRVGDAAMAVDPLSGNGIFQSLSSALQAAPVINTLLRLPERAELAKDFHQGRIEQLFLRFARIGRDFYASEQRWSEQPFWATRSCWPDQEPSHRPANFADLRIESAPVLRGDLVEQAQVVISPDQPLGMWHLQGLELAHWLRRLWQEPHAKVLAELPIEQRQRLQGWLLANGYQPDKKN